MKAYVMQVLVIDHDGYGPENAKDIVEQTRYINASVKSFAELDIGEWSDDHPLNKHSTCEAEYKRLLDLAKVEAK